HGLVRHGERRGHGARAPGDGVPAPRLRAARGGLPARAHHARDAGGRPRRAAHGHTPPPRPRRGRACMGGIAPRVARDREAAARALPVAGRARVNLRQQFQRLTGESLVYGLGQVSGRAVNLLLVPILTRVLLRQQYGVSELVTGYSASVLLVLVLGMDG